MATDVEADAYSFMGEDFARFEPHRLLTAVDEDLTTEDVQNMKFLCAGLVLSINWTKFYVSRL